MLKLIGRLIFLLSSPFLLQAQTLIGFESGVSKNYLTTSVDKGGTMNESAIGFVNGLSFQHYFHGCFSLKGLINFMNKNYVILDNSSSLGAHSKYSNQYVQLPIFMTFEYGSKTRLYLDVGFYTAYWQKAHISGNYPDLFSTTKNGNGSETIELVGYSEKYQFNNKKDRRWENGLVAGVGLMYNLGGAINTYVNMRYYLSLTDQQRNYMINQIPRYNRTITLNFGASIRL